MHQLLAIFPSAHAWWTDTVPLWKQETFPRLLLAVFLGICIGAERQWRQRAAGLRTNTLVCLGATAFVDLGMRVSPGTTQVMAYVVSGVGFLGAGAIMKEGANIKGLNTAATLWCSAAVGASLGAGELMDGVFVTGLLLVINSVLRPLSRFIDQRALAATKPYALYRVRIVCKFGHEEQVEKHLHRAVGHRSLVLRTFHLEEHPESETVILQAVLESPGRREVQVQALAVDLRESPWVDSVEYSGTDSEGE